MRCFDIDNEVFRRQINKFRMRILEDCVVLMCMQAGSLTNPPTKGASGLLWDSLLKDCKLSPYSLWTSGWVTHSHTHTVSILIQCSFQCSLKEATEVRVSYHARQLLSSFVLLALFNHNMKLDVIERVIILDGKKSTIIVLNILYVYI